MDDKHDSIIREINDLASQIANSDSSTKRKTDSLTGIRDLIRTVIHSQSRDEKKEAIAQTVSESDESPEAYLEKGRLRKKRNCPLKILAKSFGLCKDTVTKLIKEWIDENKKKEAPDVFAALESLDPNKTIYSSWSQMHLVPVKRELTTIKGENATLLLSNQEQKKQLGELRANIKYKDILITQLQNNQWVLGKLNQNVEGVEAHLVNVDQGVGIIAKSMKDFLRLKNLNVIPNHIKALLLETDKIEANLKNSQETLSELIIYLKESQKVTTPPKALISREAAA